MFDITDRFSLYCFGVVVVAQLVRALDCGSRGCRFEPGLPPQFVFKEFVL